MSIRFANRANIYLDRAFVMRLSLWKMFGLRLLLAATVISGVLGAGTYYFESARIDQEIIALAVREAGTFVDLNRNAFAPDMPSADSRLEGFLAVRSSAGEGHFVLAEIYDGGG